MGRFVERDLERAAATFQRLPLPGVIDHDAPHKLRGDGEEMGAILPLRLRFAGELEISVVNEQGGLESVAGSLLAHVTVGQTLQFRLHERDEFVERGGVAVAPGGEQRRDLFLCGGRHLPHGI